MSYYNAPDDAPSEDTTEKSPDEGSEEKGMEGETTLIPKSLLGGKEFKPGEEVVLKIVHLYDDEIEVAYATDKPKDKTRSGMHDRMNKYAEE